MKDIDLFDITYEYVVNLTKLYLEKYRDGEMNLDKLSRVIQNIVPGIVTFSYKFNEEIWPPDKPELYENLIEFKVQLRGTYSYLPFRLMVKKGYNQEVILLKPGTFLWENYGKDNGVDENMPA
jgi:hypothetical protein